LFHVAIKLWIERLELVTVDVEARRMIAVDGTEIKANGEWCYV